MPSAKVHVFIYGAERVKEAANTTYRVPHKIISNRFDLKKNQSIENAGVAFVKGANEKKKWLLQKNKQTVTYDEHGIGLTTSGTNWFGDEQEIGISLRQ